MARPMVPVPLAFDSARSVLAVKGPKRSAKDLKQQVEILSSELQGDRQSIARGLNAIWKQQQQARERQRGPERDYGPSR